MARKFVVTEDHLRLVRAMWIDWSDVEYGAPCVDPKRPYGNSDVEGDVAELLGWTVDGEDGLTHGQREIAAQLHRDTQTVLQILVTLGACKPGTYVLREQYNDTTWERAS